MRKRFLRFAVPLVLMGLVAGACSSNDDNAGASGATGETGATGAECNADVSVGVALDVGGLGDKSFNDAAKAGLDKAIADGLVCADNTEFIEANSTGSDRDQNIQSLADAGYPLVIGVGFAFSVGVSEIVPDYPDTNFAVIDGFTSFLFDDPDTEEVEPIPANVGDLGFKEQEGSFLVGAAAAIKCGCDTIGFLGGQQGIGLIERFEAGYTAGALAVNPNMTVLVKYIGTDETAFNDAVKGEALSTAMYDDGAEIIYHAAGASGAGLFNAAVKAGKLAIGVDSDQYLTASAEQQPLILTSMLKRVDVAVYNTIAAQGEGTFTSGPSVFGLAEDGVDYATSNPAELTQDIIDQLEGFREQIISGEIVVPDDPTKI
jgi:basic membrane protein A and related proteins